MSSDGDPYLMGYEDGYEGAKPIEVFVDAEAAGHYSMGYADGDGDRRAGAPPPTNVEVWTGQVRR